MTITFITGANKSLGYETARRLLELGHAVVVGARDVQRGQEAAHALGHGARFVQIDVTSDASVRTAAANVAEHEGQLDVLINIAGVSGSQTAVDEITAVDAWTVYDTNVVGVVRVTTAFLPLLRKSALPVVVNVSSGTGSFGRTHQADRLESKFAAPLYTSFKAALTMLTTQCAKALPDMRINAADPGFTATDLNNHRGTQTVTEGTDAIVALATIGSDGPSGTFQDRDGPVPW